MEPAERMEEKDCAMKKTVWKWRVAERYGGHPKKRTLELREAQDLGLRA